VSLPIATDFKSQSKSHEYDIPTALLIGGNFKLQTFESDYVYIYLKKYTPKVMSDVTPPESEHEMRPAVYLSIVLSVPSSSQSSSSLELGIATCEPRARDSIEDVVQYTLSHVTCLEDAQWTHLDALVTRLCPTHVSLACTEAAKVSTDTIRVSLSLSIYMLYIYIYIYIYLKYI
jgi:hypothetical protein